MGGGYKPRSTGADEVVDEIRDLRTQLARARRQSVNGAAHASMMPITINPSRSGVPVNLGTIGADAIRENVQVPEGFSAAAVNMYVSLDGLRGSSTGGGNTLTIQPFIDSTSGDPITLEFDAPGNRGMVMTSLAANLAGLSGSFALGALGWGAATGWMANSGNARLSALVIFLR